MRSRGTAVDRQRLIRPQPHSPHSSRHPAPSWVSARRSSDPSGRSAAHTSYRSQPALRASSELGLPSTSRPAQQTCPSACLCPGSSPISDGVMAHHTPHRQSRTPRRGLNRPACARPVAGAAALYCAQQGSLVSRLVTTGWAVLASSQPRDVASGDARLPRDAKCASATCAPLRRRQVACLSRACPSAAAALLCHLGPLLHFKKSASGCCQPPPAGGPLARRPQ